MIGEFVSKMNVSLNKFAWKSEWNILLFLNCILSRNDANFLARQVRKHSVCTI